jgi:hypothetical protein
MKNSIKNEQIFHIFLPHTLIQVLQIKLVQDNKVKKPLSAGKLIFVGAVVGLSKEKGYCWAGNKKISQLIVVPTGTLENYITQLETDKILYRYYDLGTKERRLRIHDDLISAYPELKEDLKIVASREESKDENHPRFGSDHPRFGSDHPRFGSDHPRFGSDHPRFVANAYYIYKNKERELKRKLKEKKTFLFSDFSFEIDEGEMNIYVDSNRLDEKTLQDEAFRILCDLYPVQKNLKKGRDVFNALNYEELRDLFQSLKSFREWAEEQQQKNLSDNEPIDKYIPHIKGYIENKRYLEYLKNLTKGAIAGSSGEDEYKKFLKRVEVYAIDYARCGAFEVQEEDKELDSEHLDVIVKATYENGLSADILVHCDHIFNKVERIA